MTGVRSLLLPLSYSFAEKYGLLVLALVGSMVLSRVLTPADIGVYSIAAVLAGLAQVLRDFGVGQYLMQEKQLGRQQLRAALFVCLCSAALLAALAQLCAAPLAAFYGAPGLQPVLRLLSLNFLLVPFTALTLAALRRDMRFAAVLAINAAGAAVQLGCSVWLAWRGYGSLSLAWGVLAGGAASLLASIPLRPAGLPWLPHWRGARRIVRFGAYAAGGGLIDEAGVSAPDLIVGKLLGVAAAAMYGKAQSVINLFNQAVTSAVSPVVYALYAEHARNGRDARQAYLATVACMTALAWPFFAWLALLARPAVRLLYGDQWDAAVPLIQVMCGASALYSMFNMARYLFLAHGLVRAQAELDALSVPVRVLALLLAVPLGLDYVAWGVMLGALARSLFTWRYLARLAGLPLAPQLAAVRYSAVLAALAALGAVGARAALPSGPLQLFAGGAAALLLWLGGVHCFRARLGQRLGLNLDAGLKSVLAGRAKAAASDVK